MSKLEEAARNYIDKYYADDEYPSEIKDIVTDSEQSFIAGAEWQKDNMWISVEESLPECVGERPFSEDVLIVNHGFNIGYYYKPNNQWYSNLLEDVVIAGVTHWMPIPKHDVNH